MMNYYFKEGLKFVAGGAFSMLLLLTAMYQYGDFTVNRNVVFSTALYFITFAIGLFVIYIISIWWKK